MTIKDLMQWAKEHNLTLYNAIFNNIYYIDVDTLRALAQEMSVLLEDEENEDTLIKNLKEWHEELFEEEE